MGRDGMPHSQPHLRSGPFGFDADRTWLGGNTLNTSAHRTLPASQRALRLKMRRDPNTAHRLHSRAMTDLPKCPECASAITYPTGTSMMCAECGHEWNPDEVAMAEAGRMIKDANGNELKDGDVVVVIKDLPVKGMPKPVKAGTKVKNIKLVDGDHDIDCRVDGFGAMGLKSIYVKKA